MEKVFRGSTAQLPCLLKAKQNSLQCRRHCRVSPGEENLHRRVWVAPANYCPQLDGFEAHLSFLGAICPRFYSLIKGANVIKKLPESPTIDKHFSADTHKNEKYYTAKYSMYKNVYCNISCLLVEIFLQHVSQVQKINQAFKKRLRMIHLVLS